MPVLWWTSSRAPLKSFSLAGGTLKGAKGDGDRHDTEETEQAESTRVKIE